MRRSICALLTLLGVFLLTAGVLTRHYVAPTLIGAPPDVYQVTRLRAENAAYFDVGSATPRTGASVVATSTVRGDPRAARGDVAVWDSATVVQDVERDVMIDIQRRRYAFDRRTGRLRDCCGATVQGAGGGPTPGIGLFWPVRARKEGIAVFDPATGRSWPARFAGEERVGGVRTYRFVQRVPETKVAAALPAVPGELLGRGGGGAVPVDRYHRAEATYWIDPRTGAPVDQRQRVLSTLRPKKGPGRLVVADLTLRMTPESREALMDRSRDGAGKIRLLRTVVPAVAAGAGPVLLFAAAWAGGTSRRRPGR